MSAAVGLLVRRGYGCSALRGCASSLRAYTTKVDIKALKRLRELNPVSISKAKDALVSSENDIDKALEWLEKDALKSGAKKAEKVKDRVACEGAVAVHVNDSLTAASIVELGCETDFVARNASFVDLASGIAESGMAFSKSSAERAVLADIEVSELSAQMLGERTVADTVTETIGRLGENIVLRRAAAVGSTGGSSSTVISGYVHGSVSGSSSSASAGKIGGLVAVECTAQSDDHRKTLSQLTRRLAQQVVGYAPRYTTLDQWRAARAAGIEGSEEPDVSVLESQQFLFGGGTVSEVLAKISKEIGAPVSISSFVRYERGEGIEKPAKPDFAEEVRQQLS
ncbi:translation elongation factor Ts [Martensiomyces pterosporus]|nr:translation elongation factor Ts [Martensiomyces pterosporus]